MNKKNPNASENEQYIIDWCNDHPGTELNRDGVGGWREVKETATGTCVAFASDYIRLMEKLNELDLADF